MAADLTISNFDLGPILISFIFISLIVLLEKIAYFYHQLMGSSLSSAAWLSMILLPVPADINQ